MNTPQNVLRLPPPPSSLVPFHRKGFTLIELLVVVLIIGILAAVALPQYTSAVERSRASEAYLLLKAIKGSSDRYLLERGTNPTSFADLDITVPGTCNADMTSCETKMFKVYSFGTVGPTSIIASRLNKNYFLERDQNNSKFWCAVTNNDVTTEKLCRSLSGQTAPNHIGGTSGTNRYYLLSEN